MAGVARFGAGLDRRAPAKLGCADYPANGDSGRAASRTAIADRDRPIPMAGGHWLGTGGYLSALRGAPIARSHRDNPDPPVHHAQKLAPMDHGGAYRPVVQAQ